MGVWSILHDLTSMSALARLRNEKTPGNATRVA